MTKTDIFSKLEGIFEEQRKLFDDVFKLYNSVSISDKKEQKTDKNDLVDWLNGSTYKFNDHKIRYDYPNSACKELDDYLNEMNESRELWELGDNRIPMMNKLRLYCFLAVMVSPEFAFRAIEATSTLHCWGGDYSYATNKHDWFTERWLDPRLTTILRKIHDTLPILDKIEAKITDTPAKNDIVSNKITIAGSISEPVIPIFTLTFVGKRGDRVMPTILHPYLSEYDNSRLHNLSMPIQGLQIGKVIEDIYAVLSKIGTGFRFFKS